MAAVEAMAMWGLIVRGLLAAGRALGPQLVRVATIGRIAIPGLIRNRPLAELTQQEIRNTFAKIGLREAHNSHFISRLVERGSAFGINTLDDFARAINNGSIQRGVQEGTFEILFSNGRAAIVINSLGELITFLPK